MKKCGCVTEYDRTDHRSLPDATDCLLPEAVNLIQEMLKDSAWLGSKVNLRAETFLAKVGNNILTESELGGQNVP
jgi:hypothetical protein